MIPIMRPLLPNVNSLLPYLRRIDESRWYSNFGPLVAEYEERLAARYNCHVVSCSSATVGLTACLMAIFPVSSVIGVPSWTFCASVSAIFAAGCRPLMCDVDVDNVLSVECQAMMPVMPLGAPIDFKWWSDWGRPVIVDGASGFDSLVGVDVLDLPVVVSTHCTKVFGTGEGGFILTSDGVLAGELRKIMNQGMEADKSVGRLGFNGKMSEYSAAVGLAELDGWEEKREKWKEVQRLYGEDRAFVTSTHDEKVKEGVDIESLISKMEESGIQCRASWYGTAHKQKVFGSSRSMKRTDELAARTVFLPKYVDMTREEVARVRDMFGECVA